MSAHFDRDAALAVIGAIDHKRLNFIAEALDFYAHALTDIGLATGGGGVVPAGMASGMAAEFRTMNAGRVFVEGALP